jgi:hypothetical protein
LSAVNRSQSGSFTSEQGLRGCISSATTNSSLRLDTSARRRHSFGDAVSRDAWCTKRSSQSGCRPAAGGSSKKCVRGQQLFRCPLMSRRFSIGRPASRSAGHGVGSMPCRRCRVGGRRTRSQGCQRPRSVTFAGFRHSIPCTHLLPDVSVTDWAVVSLGTGGYDRQTSPSTPSR